jgi:hypothetical protein
LLAHLLQSAIRSLAVTVVLGSILIYATGGLDSPNARGMVGIVAVCFFLFWITFYFMFGPRVPRRRSERDIGPDETPHVLLRVGRRREHDDDSGDDGDTGAGGDSGGGGD